MRTFEECKEEIAKQYDCIGWDNLLLNIKMKTPDLESISRGLVYDEAAELYAKEAYNQAIVDACLKLEDSEFNWAASKQTKEILTLKK